MVDHFRFLRSHGNITFDRINNTHSSKITNQRGKKWTTTTTNRSFTTWKKTIKFSVNVFLCVLIRLCDFFSTIFIVILMKREKETNIISKHLVILFWSINAGNKLHWHPIRCAWWMFSFFLVGTRHYSTCFHYICPHTHINADARTTRANKKKLVPTIRSMCRSNRFNHKVRYANDGCVSVYILLRPIDCLELKTEKSTVQSTCRIHATEIHSYRHRCRPTAQLFSIFSPLTLWPSSCVRLKFLLLLILSIALKIACHCQFVRIN